MRATIRNASAGFLAVFWVLSGLASAAYAQNAASIVPLPASLNLGPNDLVQYSIDGSKAAILRGRGEKGDGADRPGLPLSVEIYSVNQEGMPGKKLFEDSAGFVINAYTWTNQCFLYSTVKIAGDGEQGDPKTGAANSGLRAWPLWKIIESDLAGVKFSSKCGGLFTNADGRYVVAVDQWDRIAARWDEGRQEFGEGISGERCIDVYEIATGKRIVSSTVPFKRLRSVSDPKEEWVPAGVAKDGLAFAAVAGNGHTPGSGLFRIDLKANAVSSLIPDRFGGPNDFESNPIRPFLPLNDQAQLISWVPRGDMYRRRRFIFGIFDLGQPSVRLVNISDLDLEKTGIQGWDTPIAWTQEGSRALVSDWKKIYVFNWKSLKCEAVMANPGQVRAQGWIDARHLLVKFPKFSEDNPPQYMPPNTWAVLTVPGLLPGK